MTRSKDSPSPLLQVSVTGVDGVSVPALARHTVSGPGSFGVPPWATQPNSAK